MLIINIIIITHEELSLRSSGGHCKSTVSSVN